MTLLLECRVSRGVGRPFGAPDGEVRLGQHRAERARRGIVRLPATQAEALDALAADDLLTSALGPTLAEAFLAVRRSEWAAYSAGDAAFEQQGHFEKY